MSDDSLYQVPEADNLMVIGATQSEKFVRDFAGKKGITDIHKISVTGFPFSMNYLFLRLIGPSPEKRKKIIEDHPDAKIDITAAQKKQFTKMIRAQVKRNNLRASKHPALVVTASKKKQEKWFKNLGAGSTIITNHDIEGVWSQVYCAGNVGIFTQNSTISRGIDIPFFDLTYFAPGGFATPQQTAKIQVLIEEKSDLIETQQQQGNKKPDTSDIDAQIKSLWKEIKAIQSDEITNNILRSAPIRSDPSEQRLKVVVMCEKDYQKLDPRIKKLTKSMAVSDDEDPTLLLDALDSIHHPVTAVDANPDRPKPARSKATPPITEIRPALSLEEQQKRIFEFRQYRDDNIDRTKIPYKKIITDIVKIPRLKTKNKSGRYGQLGRDALINYLSKWNGTNIPEKIIRECILCALQDRILIEEHRDCKCFYRLHENVIGKITGVLQKGPPYPAPLDILHVDGAIKIIAFPNGL